MRCIHTAELGYHGEEEEGKGLSIIKGWTCERDGGFITAPYRRSIANQDSLLNNTCAYTYTALVSLTQLCFEGLSHCLSLRGVTVWFHTNGLDHQIHDAQKNPWGHEVKARLCSAVSKWASDFTEYVNKSINPRHAANACSITSRRKTTFMSQLCFIHSLKLAIRVKRQLDSKRGYKALKDMITGDARCPEAVILCLPRFPPQVSHKTARSHFDVNVRRGLWVGWLEVLSMPE